MRRSRKILLVAAVLLLILVLPLLWLSRRGSSFIWGVWHDAKHVAGHIATQRTYLAYRDREQRAADEQQPSISNVSTFGAL